MIKQVGFNNAKYSFVPFKGDGTSFAVSEPYQEPKFDGFKKEHDEFKKEKEEKTSKLGYAIFGIASIAGLGFLGLGKLFSRRSSFKASKFLEAWEVKAEKLGFFKAYEPVKKLLGKAKAIFNIATVKDSFFKWATPKWLDEKITKAFERLSVRTSRKAYDKATLAFDSMFAKFDKFNSKLTPEQVGKVNQKIADIRATYAKGFSETARNQRLGKTKHALSGLFEKVWAQIKNPGKYCKEVTKGRFFAEEEAQSAKIMLGNSVSGLKEKISNSSKDKHLVTKDLLDRLGLCIDTRDKNARDLMKKLWGHLDGYKKNPRGLNYDNISSFPTKEVKRDLTELSNHISKSSEYYKGDSKNATIDAIQNLTKSLQEDKMGEVQEIMEIYNGKLTDEDYKVLQKSVNKTMKKFNHAIDLESDKLFDKIRDLNLGSASHDVLAFGLSLAGIGWGISKVDNKDERISVTLKYGIPALFGVAMAIACTVGLVASGPSLLIGLASTIPVNMLGKVIDNARKKKEEDPQANLLPKLKFESPLQMIKDINNTHYKSV